MYQCTVRAAAAASSIRVSAKRDGMVRRSHGKATPLVDSVTAALAHTRMHTWVPAVNPTDELISRSTVNIDAVNKHLILIIRPTQN